jgi:hypothetical protein
MEIIDCVCLVTTAFSQTRQTTVTCLTEGNDCIRDTAGNNCKLVHNRIQDTVAPFPVTVTIGLYGYEAKNSMWGYVATGESALEVSRQLVAGISASVSLWKQKSPVLAVNYRRRKPVFRRVTVVSGVRSHSLY